MGSAESQLAAGVFPGDSQRDEDSPQFLTPDLLERTWLDLDPSPDLDKGHFVREGSSHVDQESQLHAQIH